MIFRSRDDFYAEIVRPDTAGLTSQRFINMMNADEIKVRDQSQNEVININKGCHLVLAPPGCGKTDILAERIKRALERGADPKGMACLTFTNRASRGMLARIQSNCGADTSEIFVGNVHRFCSRFLFDNGYIPLTASILDEYDVYGILLSLINRDEDDADNLEFDLKNALDSIAHIASYMYQLRHHHEVMLYDKYEAIGWLTDYFGCDELELFDNAAGFYQKVRSENLFLPDTCKKGLNRVKIARRYAEYKKKFAALDFDDLLLKTYTALRDPQSGHRRFTWMQIDEVQDLNPLQLAICDLLLAADKNTCVLYLGDEQQAIFSFMGASQEQLNIIKNRCQGNIHRLYNNYRSPSYLLNIYNTYANYQLDMDPALLPRPVKNEAPVKNDLLIVESENFSREISMALRFCRWVSGETPRHENDQQRIALVVTNNKDADELSRRFLDAGVSHFKVSGQDAFLSRTITLLFSHLTTFVQDSNLIAWAKIFRHLKLFEGRNQYAKSREFVKQLFDNMISPSDLLRYDNYTSYMEEASHKYNGEMVIFDTETTGLDVYNDDIVQIAAVKIFAGDITARFNIILKTEKEIPAMLGDIVNPLLAEYSNPETVKYERSAGLQLFLDFIADAGALVAHNADYDYRILDNNLKRDLGFYDFTVRHPVYFDTLKISRLVRPHLSSYKLVNLLKVFDLEGQNSHLADDDAEATANLLEYCIGQYTAVRESQFCFFEENRAVIDLLRAKYLQAWQHTEQVISSLRGNSEHESVLASEMKWLYAHFVKMGLCEECGKFDYIVKFIDSEVVNKSAENNLYEQLFNHAVELRTFREADLCESRIINEKIFISTVHKAKGLEFENVLVLNAIDQVYPFYFSDTPEKKREDARKFYVAISRAKIRLVIMTARNRTVISRKTNLPCSFRATPTPFLNSIREYFTFVTA